MKANLELQAIDGNWYTFYASAPIALKAGRSVKAYSDRLYAVTEKIWIELKKQYSYTTNF